MADYPTNLPTPLIDGYNYDNQSQFIRSELETGLARQRRIYTTYIFKINVEFIFTSQELERFESFYFDDLSGGVDWFNISIFISGGYETQNARFIRNYNVESLATDIFKVSSMLEVRNVSILTKELRDLIDTGMVDFNEQIKYSILYDIVHTKIGKDKKW